MNHKFIPVSFFVLLLAVSVALIWPFIVPILAAMILAFMFYPVFKAVNVSVKNRNISSFLVSLFVILLLIIPLFFIANTVTSEVRLIYLEGKRLLLAGTFSDCSLGVCSFVKDLLADPQINSFFSSSISIVSETLLNVAKNFLLSIPRFLFMSFVAFFLLFFFLRDGYKLVLFFEHVLHLKKRHQAQLVKKIKNVLNAVVYGNIVISLIQGFLGGLGFFLLGISSPIVWGLAMSVFAFIPYFGTAIIWLPAALLLIFQGIFMDQSLLLFKGVILLVYGVLIVGSIDNVLKPKFIGSKSQVHPAIILLGLLGGIVLFGVVGFVIGPLVLALTVTVVEIYIKDRK